MTLYLCYMACYIIFMNLVLSQNGIFLWAIGAVFTWLAVYFTLTIPRMQYYYHRVNPAMYQQYKKRKKDICQVTREVLDKVDKSDMWKKGFLDGMGMVDYCMAIERKKLAGTQYGRKDFSAEVTYQIAMRTEDLKDIGDTEFKDGQESAIGIGLAVLAGMIKK